MSFGMTLMGLVYLCSFLVPVTSEAFRCPRVSKWLSLNRTISVAYSHMGSGRPHSAWELLVPEVGIVLDDLPQAFNCSIGVAALYRALGLAYGGSSARIVSNSPRRRMQVSLRLLHTSMNWLTHAFVIMAKNDARWVDESEWPITIQSINEEESFFQRAIFETGHYGSKPAMHGIRGDFRDPTLRIAIVSLCDYPVTNPLPVLSKSNRDLYASEHGYGVIEKRMRYDPSRPHAWGKIPLLMEHIMDPRFDWLLWFDCDTYFMDFNVTLDSILYEYGGSQDGRGLSPDFTMLIQEDHAMLNTGVFFIRTGEWSRSLLERVYGTQLSPWIHHPWWENAAFSHEFLWDLAPREFRGEHFQAVGDDMDGIYPNGVRVAYQARFNSYHPMTSRVFMHDTWAPGKFVLAFSGCKSASSESVVKQLYVNYYLLMCELNNALPKCVKPQDFWIG